MPDDEGPTPAEVYADACDPTTGDGVEPVEVREALLVEMFTVVAALADPERVGPQYEARDSEVPLGTTVGWTDDAGLARSGVVIEYLGDEQGVRPHAVLDLSDGALTAVERDGLGV